MLDPGTVAGVVAVGGGVGVSYGLFGAGASAFATPVLAVLGIPPLAAVASPLPATIPAALVAARRHLKTGGFDRGIVLTCAGAGAPAALVGALFAGRVPGHLLLALSGLLLLPLGLRMLRPAASDPTAVPGRAMAALRHRPVLAGTAAGIGLLSGLLANSGGFLLVPLFILGIGMTARRAAGTSLLTATAITLPTLAAHWFVGHIDWTIAIAFGIGLLPGSQLGARLGEHVDGDKLARTFGALLLALAGLTFLKLA